MNDPIDFADILRSESGYRGFEPWSEPKKQIREFIVRVAQREIGALESRLVALAGAAVAAEAEIKNAEEAVRNRWKARLANAKTEFEQEKAGLSENLATANAEPFSSTS